jgi:predicted dehydrogenase
VNDDPARAAAAAQAAGAGLLRATSRVEDVVDDTTVRAAIVTLPTRDAPAVAARLLGAGKHVLLEKPGALSARDFDPVRAASAGSGRVLSISYPLRHHPVAQAIRALVERGALGRIVSFEARWIASQVTLRDPTHWLFREEQAGGGIFSWLACHWVDLLRFWLRDEIAEVAAMTANNSPDLIEVEDTAAVIARTRGGAVGTIRVGYHLAVSSPGYVGGRYDTYLSLAGTHGCVRWAPHGERPQAYWLESVADAPGGEAGELEVTVPAKAGYNGYAGYSFVRSFLDAARGDAEPPTNAADALAVLKVIDAVYASAAKGRYVAVG